MLTSKVFAITSLVTSVLAIGRAIVTNQCDSPIYLWSVGNNVSTEVILPKDSSYGEKFNANPAFGGIALKTTSQPGGLFVSDVSQLIFAYNVDNSSVWYDLSSLFGDGFAGRTLEVQPDDDACDSIERHDGRTPAGSQVRKCQRETNLELTFCTGHCLPSWCKLRRLVQFVLATLTMIAPCGNNAPNETRTCCTHCIGSHHCVAP